MTIYFCLSSTNITKNIFFNTFTVVQQHLNNNSNSSLVETYSHSLEVPNNKALEVQPIVFRLG